LERCNIAKEVVHHDNNKKGYFLEGHRKRYDCSSLIALLVT